MKKINSIAVVFILLIFIGCIDKGKEGIPRADFLKDTFNFEKIKKGDSLDISFTLKNSGTGDMLIKSSSVACGCTKVKPLKDTIAPDETVDIKVVYNSKDDSGNVFKTVVIETNTNPKLHVLYIKGFVE